MVEQNDGVGIRAVKFKTWVQVAAAGILGIIQIAQMSLRPEMALYGAFSIVILASLVGAIVYSDYKTNMAENELKRAESQVKREYEALKSEIPMIELTAQKRGAEMALQDVVKSFREDAKSARYRRTREIYLKAAKLVSRQRRLLDKMQEIARRK